MTLQRIELSAADDVAGFWRRALALGDIFPNEVVFEVAGDTQDLFADEQSTPDRSHPFRMQSFPSGLKDLLDKVVMHSDPERFALAFRLLHRSRREPHLLSIGSDRDIARARKMEKAVRRDMHKMTAFVRFREVIGPGGSETFVAWFEPEHHIVAATAPFFVRRFANMRWSILTPRRSAHWDLETLTIADGATPSDAAAGDPVEDVWRTYYAHIFNPARLMPKAMQTHMPKKYWHNLPESRLIRPLIATARARSEAMIAAPATQARRSLSACATHSRETSALRAEEPLTTLSDLPHALSACRRCALHCHATQPVAGHGPDRAPLMIVGEQPGDQEDIAGKPFVGPAGRVLDIALERTGIDRRSCYVTNAVKHFKFEARGKHRLHKSPDAAEIEHCRWWLQQERALVRPELIVALGATAIRAVFGKALTVSSVRSAIHQLDDGTAALATVHPSYLLRLNTEDEKRAQWRAFLADLATARSWLDGRAAAAEVAAAPSDRYSTR